MDAQQATVLAILTEHGGWMTQREIRRATRAHGRELTAHAIAGVTLGLALDEPR